MQFGTGVDIRDLVTAATFDSHRLRRFWMVVVEFQAFPLTFKVALIACRRVIISVYTRACSLPVITTRVLIV